MAQKDRKSAYEDELSEARWMVEGVSDGDFELEGILAEYGRGVAGSPPEEEEPTLIPEEETVPPARGLRFRRRKKAAAEEEHPPEGQTAAKPECGAAEEPAANPEETPAEPAGEHPEEKPEECPEPQPELTLEDVVSRTIDEVMEERANRAARNRRGLFSRRRLRHIGRLYGGGNSAPEEEPEREEPIGPEKPLGDVWTASRRRLRGQRRRLFFAAVLTVLAVALLIVEEQGIVLPYWTGSVPVQAAVLGSLLGLTAILCWDVFWRTCKAILRGRFPCDLLVSTAAIVTLADCATWPFFAERPACMPYAAPVCAVLTAALWGEKCRMQAICDTCRTAALTDSPPYLVADTPEGACKQKGKMEGFYTDLMKDEGPVLWQTALVPVIFMAALVFSGLASLGKGLDETFLLSWSAVLTASCSLSLPLVWTLPWSGLAKQLLKSNCAVAGWAGAERISRKKAMILGDEDLFPPGTVKINGIKLYGEEMGRAVAYAASLLRESGSGLARLFDGLLKGENETYMELDDFSFYEEGGFSADYKGESLLLGTASFMRKMDVRLPGSLNLRTGIFLAVDRQLVAVFAVKYEPSENVDWAIQILRRNRITPVLASRDPNITPQMLKRKFSKGLRVQYPTLTYRLALSEQEEKRGRRPRAVLLREGLLPYAETVVGSRRLCRSARESAVFALLGSAIGTLLTGYLVNLGSFSLMEPLTVLVFLVLWVTPVLLLSAWAGRF